MGDKDFNIFEEAPLSYWEEIHTVGYAVVINDGHIVDLIVEED